MDFGVVLVGGGVSIRGEEDRGVGGRRCGFSVDQVSLNYLYGILYRIVLASRSSESIF